MQKLRYCSGVLMCLLFLMASHSGIAQESNTAIFDWGDATNGQLDRPFNASDVNQISGGYVHTLTLENGTVEGYGSNINGQLSIPSISEEIIQISAGLGHSVVLLQDSTVIAWGKNNFGQSNVPNNLEGVLSIGAGDIHTIALLDSGVVVAWGDNEFGQLSVPDEMDSIIAISAGNFHNLGIKSDSTVVAWGKNDFGQCNIPTINEAVIKVAAGEYHSFALTEGGNLIGWGDNLLFGQLNVPGSIQGNVIDIEAGNHHTIALLSDSTVVSWGNGTYNQTFIPTVLDGRTVYEINAGYGHTSTITSNMAPNDISLYEVNVRENPDGEVIFIAANSTDLDEKDVHEIDVVESAPLNLIKYAGPLSVTNELFYNSYNLSNFSNIFYTSYPFDYEDETSHTITFRATDLGGLTFEKAIKLKIIDINEEPDSILLDSMEIFESQPIGTFIGNFSTIDPDQGDTHTYSFSSGPGSLDNQYFSIEDGKLLSDYVFNYSERQSYLIRVRSTDSGGLFTDENFVITIKNLNNPPTEISLSNYKVYDKQDPGILVGRLQTKDKDKDDTFTYEFTEKEGNSNDRFEIRGTSLYTNDTFDFETDKDIFITVTSTDSGNPAESVTQDLEIEILKSNEAPTDILLSNHDVNKLADPGLIVAQIFAADPDENDSHTFELVNGTGADHNDYFVVQNSRLVLNQSISDYEEDTLTIRLKATDNGKPSRLSIEKAFTLNVYEEDANNVPTNITLSNNEIQENNELNDFIGYFSTTDADEDESFIYYFSQDNGANDNGSFILEDSTLLSNRIFDFETRDAYRIEVTVQDKAGDTFTREFDIFILDQQDSPTALTLSNFSIKENEPVSSLVGNIILADDDENGTYTYTAFNDAGDVSEDFEVVNEQLISLRSFNFEQEQGIFVSILVEEENTGSLQSDFVINIIDVDEAPSDLILDNNSVSETSQIGAIVGNFNVVDEDINSNNILSLIAGDGDSDNGSFLIEEKQLVLNDTLNYDSKQTYSIRVQAASEEGTEIQKVFTIEVIEENINNLSPEALILDGYTIEENQQTKTFIGQLKAIDPDDDDGFIFYLSEGEGDADNSNFVIESDSLFAVTSFNFEEKYVYSIRATVQDNDGETYSKFFYINVLDVNEEPTDIILSSDIIKLNDDNGTFVAFISTEDEDLGQTYTYTLTEGELFNEYFSILNGNELWANGEVNSLNRDELSIQIESSDSGNPSLGTEKVFELIVSTPPTILSTYFKVEEDAEANHSLGEIKLDTQKPVDFEIISGNVNSVFKVNDNDRELLLAQESVLNYDEIPQYQIGIRVTNEEGLSSIGIVNVEVIPVDRPVLNAGFFSIPEDTPTNETIGHVTFNSKNPENLSFSITSGNVNRVFEILSDGGIRLNTQLNYEDKNNYELTIDVESTSGYSSEALYIINVTDANDEPFDIILDNNSISERQNTGTLIGNLSVSDEDPTDSHEFTITSNTDLVTIQGNQLLVNDLISNSSTPEIILTIRATDDGNPALFVESEFNIEVLPLPDINIPNAFSPDGNGINDLWEIENISLYPGAIIEVKTMQGLMVFQSTGNGELWDGSYNGSSLPVGTYYYFIKLAGQKSITGTVTILK